jgi:hypothetical protein
VSDIDTAVVDSLKVLDLKWPIREVLDLKWPIREADIRRSLWNVGFVPIASFAATQKSRETFLDYP